MLFIKQLPAPAIAGGSRKQYSPQIIHTNMSVWAVIYSET